MSNIQRRAGSWIGSFSFVLSAQGAMASDPTKTQLTEPGPSQVELYLCKTRPELQKSVRNVRTIRIESQKDFCRVTYTKNQVEENVGSARYLASCRNIALNIKKNLESSIWTCRKVSHASESTSSEARPL